MGCFAGDDEDARADNAANAQARQGPCTEHPAQTVLAFHLLVDQTERFSLEQMLQHKSIPLLILTPPTTMAADGTGVHETPRRLVRIVPEPFGKSKGKPRAVGAGLPHRLARGRLLRVSSPDPPGRPGTSA